MCQIYSRLVQARNLCKRSHLIFIVRITLPCKGKCPQTHNALLVGLLFLGPSLLSTAQGKLCSRGFWEHAPLRLSALLTGFLLAPQVISFLKRLNTQPHSSYILMGNLFLFSCIPIAPDLAFPFLRRSDEKWQLQCFKCP